MKLRRVVLISLVVFLTHASRASATPIGWFFYDFVDPVFATPSFSVQNLSDALPLGADFTSVTVHLEASGSEVASFLLPDVSHIDPFNTESTANLFPLSDYYQYNFDSASLTFAFAIPGTINFEQLRVSGIIIDPDFQGPQSLSAPIEFTPVPEPATLILASVGLGVAFARRRFNKP